VISNDQAYRVKVWRNRNSEFGIDPTPYSVGFWSTKMKCAMAKAKPIILSVAGRSPKPPSDSASHSMISYGTPHIVARWSPEYTEYIVVNWAASIAGNLPMRSIGAAAWKPSFCGEPRNSKMQQSSA
jgi:hypothetical protein